MDDVFKLQEDAKKRSSAYKFTYVPGDPDGQLSMDQTKQMVAAHNKTAADGEKLDIRRKARLGRNNPASKNYKSRRGGGPQHIRLADGERFDVYLHRRSK